MFRTPVRLNKPKEDGAMQRRIAVVGAGPGCGVSFISGCIACALSKDGDLTLAELGKPGFYYSLNVEKRFSDRDFLFYEEAALTGRSPRSIRNRAFSMNLLLRKPGCEPDTDMFPDFCGQTVVADCSGLDDAFIRSRIFPWADSVIIVADPLPGALLSGFSRLQAFKLSRPDAVFVVNRMNSGVHTGELKRFLGCEDFLEMPFIQPELVYKAEYNCLFPMDVPKAAKLLAGPVGALTARLDAGIR